MATFSGWKTERFSGAADNRDFTLGVSPSAGNTILVTVWRSNAGTTGSQNHATATDFTEMDHVDPASTYRMIGTALKKEAAGGETTINFDWTATDGEGDQIICSVIVSGAIHSSIVASLQDANASTWTYPTDTLDWNIHSGATQENDDISALMYPSGDTNITHSVINWRNGGISLAGGNTTTADFGESQSGAFGTISGSDAPTTPLTSVSSIDEDEELSPAEDLTDVDVLVTSSSTITAVNMRVVRDSDGYYWNSVSSAWQAGSIAEGASVSQSSPYTHNFTTGPGQDDLTPGATYQIETKATNASGASAYVVREFTFGTWSTATDITVTMATVMNNWVRAGVHIG